MNHLEVWTRYQLCFHLSREFEIKRVWFRCHLPSQFTCGSVLPPVECIRTEACVIPLPSTESIIVIYFSPVCIIMLRNLIGSQYRFWRTGVMWSRVPVPELTSSLNLLHLWSICARSPWPCPCPCPCPCPWPICARRKRWFFFVSMVYQLAVIMLCVWKCGRFLFAWWRHVMTSRHDVNSKHNKNVFHLSHLLMVF